MENASKALLIAGSILIVILLIALGMRIFNSASSTESEVEGSMQTTEISMFNSQFLVYTGNNKSKAETTDLLKKIMVNNTSANNPKVYYL